MTSLHELDQEAHLNESDTVVCNKVKLVRVIVPVIELALLEQCKDLLAPISDSFEGSQIRDNWWDFRLHICLRRRETDVVLFRLGKIVRFERLGPSSRPSRKFVQALTRDVGESQSRIKEWSMLGSFRDLRSCKMSRRLHRRHPEPSGGNYGVQGCF